MADGEADEDLFADLYDGDDAEQDTAPVKNEPDAPVKEEIKEEPVIAAGSTGGPSNEQEYHDDSKQEQGHDNMESMQDYGHTQREERPIGIKEDG